MAGLYRLLLLVLVPLAGCNDVTLHGRVLLPDGSPAVGVTVYASGALVVATDDDGHYFVDLDPTDEQLEGRRLHVTTLHDTYGGARFTLESDLLIPSGEFSLPELRFWDSQVQVAGDGTTTSWAPISEGAVYGLGLAVEYGSRFNPAILADAGTALSITVDLRETQDLYPADSILVAESPSQSPLVLQVEHASTVFPANRVEPVPQSRDKLCSFSIEPCHAEVPGCDPFVQFYQCTFTDGRAFAVDYWDTSGTIDMGSVVNIDAISFTQFQSKSGPPPDETLILHVEVSDDLANWSALGSKEIVASRGILRNAVLSLPTVVAARYVRWMYDDETTYDALIGEVGVWTVPASP